MVGRHLPIDTKYKSYKSYKSYKTIELEDVLMLARLVHRES
jgi:hypothetical protein